MFHVGIAMVKMGHTKHMLLVGAFWAAQVSVFGVCCGEMAYVTIWFRWNVNALVVAKSHMTLTRQFFRESCMKMRILPLRLATLRQLACVLRCSFCSRVTCLLPQVPISPAQAMGTKAYLGKDVEKMFNYDYVHRQGAQIVDKKLKVSMCAMLMWY